MEQTGNEARPYFPFCTSSLVTLENGRRPRHSPSYHCASQPPKQQLPNDRALGSQSSGRHEPKWARHGIHAKPTSSRASLKRKTKKPSTKLAGALPSTRHRFERVAVLMFDKKTRTRGFTASDSWPQSRAGLDAMLGPPGAEGRLVIVAPIMLSARVCDWLELFNLGVVQLP